jgi:hypothetical protein
MEYKYQRILWEIEIQLEKKVYKKTNSVSQKSCIPIDFQELNREGFYIHKNQGNNSFDYVEEKKLWIPPLISGDEEDILPGEKIVFQDEAQICYGLMSYVYGKTRTNKVPIFLCDNHNAVLEIWKPFSQKNKNNPILIHIDQHKDDAIFHGSSTDDFKKTTKICDYIDYAIQKKWMNKNYYSFTEVKDLHQFDVSQLSYDNNYILNIDLDFFALEMTAISLDQKIEIITQCLPYTGLITLATSPLFINQEFAREIAKLFWRYF